MAARVQESAAEVTISGEDVSIISAGTVGPAGTDGADGVNGVDGADGADGLNGSDGADGADGADGVGPIDVTGIQNALIVAEQETLCYIGSGPSGSPGYTEDLRESMIGKNLDISSGRIDYNYDELTLDFDDNARYTEEVVGLNFQLPHAWIEGDAVDVHLHWLQNQNAVPNWLSSYRILSLGGAPASWSTPTSWMSSVFTYTSGNLHQIAELHDVTMTGVGISSILQVKIWRDTNNSSGVFAGSDPYSGAAGALYCDCHVRLNSIGSVAEYDKDGL